MQKEISKMSGHFIICGAGRVGRNIAIELQRTERDFVLIDENEQACIDLINNEKLNSLFAVGDGSEDGFLESVGAKTAKGLFVTTGDDNTNLVICLTARQMNPLLKIVARSKELYNVTKMKRAGANRVVTPNYIGGLRMASEMLRPAATNLLDEMIRSKGSTGFEEFVIPESFENRRYGDLPVHDLPTSLVIAIHDGDEWLFKPSDDLKLTKNMQLLMVTTAEDRKTIEKSLYN